MAPKSAAPAAASSSSNTTYNSSEEEDMQVSPKKPLASSPNKKKRKADPEDKKTGGVGGSQKLKLFQRLWSDKDEIAILHGILKYNAKTAAALPSKKHMHGFWDSIRKHLTTIDISETQLYEKVRKLKRKYDKNPAPKSFANPHDSAVFELSHKIWGPSKPLPENGGNDGAVDAKEGRNAVLLADVDGDLAKVKPRYIFLKHAITQMGDCIPCSVELEEVLDFLNESKAMAIEEKLKKLWNLQMKEKIREMEIMEAVRKMVMEASDKMG